MSQDYCIERVEELPVTLQIAMIASDGWILASDRRSVGHSRQQDGSDAFLTKDTRKIEASPSGLNLAYMCAGSDDVRRAGIALVDRLKDTNLPFNWQDIRSELAPFGKAQQPLSYGSYCLTMVFYPPALSKPQLWSVKLRPNPLPEQVTQFDVSGDFNSGARLLPQLYYSKRSCDELIRLAAFTILYGHLFNPSNVAGLDVLVGRDAEEPKFLEESDLNILRGDFKTFDADVAKRFSTNLSNLDNYR